MTKTYRIGQIVPSSNTTMETEIPAMLRLREAIRPERFTFHSSRMRMKKVVKEELAAMDAESDRCALELSDAAGFPTPGDGKVVRLNRAGDIEDVATGLSVPTGMTFGPDGYLYVSNFGAAPTGQIIRISVH